MTQPERPAERPPHERIGRYEVLRKIATGGMAELFLAKHVGMEGFEKLVAIKRILAHLAYDEEFINMFRDEARLVAKLAHPNIVEIYDLGKSSDSYFIAMEYIAGRNLASVAKKSKARGEPLPPIHIARCVGQACEALFYAHTRLDTDGRPMGIVHRDVSPQNIIVGFSGNVKLVDFGIAKAATKIAHTRAGVLKGKYAYMSPEQIRGEEIDARSDLFSVGIVLYELLCGRRPFEKETAIQTLKSIVQEPHVDPRALQPLLPDGLADIINKCLVKKRDQRFQTAQQVQVALEDLVASSGERANNAAIGAWMNRLFEDELDKLKVGSVNVKGLGEVLLPPSEKNEPSAEIEVDLDDDADGADGADGEGSAEDEEALATRPPESDLRPPGTLGVRGGGSLAQDSTAHGRPHLLHEGVITGRGAVADDDSQDGEATQHAGAHQPASPDPPDLDLGLVQQGPLEDSRPLYEEVDRRLAPTKPAPGYDDGLTEAADEQRLARIRELDAGLPPALDSDSFDQQPEEFATLDLIQAPQVAPPPQAPAPVVVAAEPRPVTPAASVRSRVPPPASALAASEEPTLGPMEPSTEGRAELGLSPPEAETPAPTVGDPDDDDLWGDKTTADPPLGLEEEHLPEGIVVATPDETWGDATRRGDTFGSEATLSGDALAAAYAGSLGQAFPARARALPSEPPEPWGEKTTASPDDPAEPSGVRLFDDASWGDGSRGTISEHTLSAQALGAPDAGAVDSDWLRADEATVGATDAWRVPQPASGVVRFDGATISPAVDRRKNVERDSATVAATSRSLSEEGFELAPDGAFAYDQETTRGEESEAPAKKPQIGALKLAKAPAVPRGGVREANGGGAPSSFSPPTPLFGRTAPAAESAESEPAKPAIVHQRSGGRGSERPAGRAPSLLSPIPQTLPPMPARMDSAPFARSEAKAEPRSESRANSIARSAERSGVQLLPERAPDRPPERQAQSRAPSSFTTDNEPPLPPGGALLSPLSIDAQLRPAIPKPLMAPDPVAAIGSTRVPPASVSLSEMLLDSDDHLKAGSTLKSAASVRGATLGGGGPPRPPVPRAQSMAETLPAPNVSDSVGKGSLREIREMRRPPMQRGPSLTGIGLPQAEGVAPAPLQVSLSPPASQMSMRRGGMSRSQIVILAIASTLVAALLGALVYLRFRAPSLEITTNPPGAQVFVANQLIPGVTPVSVSIEPDVDYPLRIVRVGYETHHQVVRIPRGKRAWRAAITLKLSASTATAAAPAP